MSKNKELDKSISLSWLRSELAREQQKNTNLSVACQNLLGWMRYVRLPIGEEYKNNFAADLDFAREALGVARATEGGQGK